MKSMSLISAGALAAFAWALASGPAVACSIMPPPPPPPVAAGTSAADEAALTRAWSDAQAVKYGVEQRDWTLKQQAYFFDNAASLVLVRFDRQEDSKPSSKSAPWQEGSPKTVLKALRWVKGSGPLGVIKLGMTVPPPCGQIKGHDAYYGKPGDVFLLYLSGNTLRSEDVLEAFSIQRIIEPRTIAALTAP